MGLDWPLQGKGTDIKGKKKTKYYSIRQIQTQGFVVLQAGFKSASDYETFVWVRENELPEMNEVIQVKCLRGIFVLFQTNTILIHN